MNYAYTKFHAELAESQSNVAVYLCYCFEYAEATACCRFSVFKKSDERY
jgi:hypothetical protein